MGCTFATCGSCALVGALIAALLMIAGVWAHARVAYRAKGE